MFSRFDLGLLLAPVILAEPQNPNLVEEEEALVEQQGGVSGSHRSDGAQNTRQSSKRTPTFSLSPKTPLMEQLFGKPQFQMDVLESAIAYRLSEEQFVDYLSQIL